MSSSHLTVVSFSSEVPNGQHVIERLEEALTMAKKGGVDNCVVIITRTDGSVMDCWANGNKPFVMVGALESVKREFMDAKIEGRQGAD